MSTAMPMQHLYMYHAKAVWLTAATVGVGVSGVTSKLRDSTDAFDISFSGQLVADLSLSGAGGLDTGSEAASTPYALFVIADTDTENTPKAMFSLSGAAPTMPSGYDIFRLVDWVSNDGSSNILGFKMSGNGTTKELFYLADGADLIVLNGGTFEPPGYVDVDLSSLVPEGVTKILIAGQFQSTAAGDFCRVKDKDSPSTTLNLYRVGIITTNNASFHLPMTCDSARKIQYNVDGASSALSIYLLGYTLEL